MIDYQRALALVLESVTRLHPVRVPLDEGLGMVLAKDVYAGCNLPPADHSAMDGYAVAAQHQDARESDLREVGFVPAGGRVTERITAGEAVRIMTGAPLPDGCDTVVPIEDVERLDGDRIRLRKKPRHSQHVRCRGEEFRLGKRILAAGSLLDAGAIGLLAAAAVTMLTVYPAPRVAVLSTGDELCELDQVQANDKLVNSNAHFVAARLRENGCIPIPLGIAKDNPDDLERCLRRGLDADLLVTSGGTSVGDCDNVHDVLSALGFEQKFRKVAIKPGKSVFFGMIGRLPVFGLPGNPTATAATFDLFVLPALRRLAGHQNPSAPRINARLAGRVTGGGGAGGGARQRFIRGRLHAEAGQLSFSPSDRHSVGRISGIQGANALLPVAIGSPDLNPGEQVEVIVLRGFYAIPSG